MRRCAFILSSQAYCRGSETGTHPAQSRQINATVLPYIFAAHCSWFLDNSVNIAVQRTNRCRSPNVPPELCTLVGVQCFRRRTGGKGRNRQSSIMVLILSTTSARVPLVTFPFFSASRSRQSKLLIWSAKIAPFLGLPSTRTSKG